MRVSKNMTRLAPQEPITYGFYGEACLLNNKRDEAKQAFTQAIMLTPDDDFAGTNLFDLYFEDGDTENSRNVLKTLTTFLKNDLSLIREIVFYSKTGEFDNCETLWRELCLCEKATRHDFEYVLKHLREMKLIEKDFIWKTLRETVVLESANALTGSYLIERIWEKQGEKACRSELTRLRENPKVWESAVGKFIELLLKNQKIAEVESFIDENEAALKTSDNTWASVGYALIAAKNYEKCNQWFNDWENREKIEPWMLWNYSNSLRYTGDTETAHRVSQKALELKTPDDSINLHLTMLGADELHNGNYAAAEQIFRQINPSTMTDWEVYFYHLLKYGLGIKNTASADAANEVDVLLKEITNYCLKQPNLWKDRIQKHYFERSFRQNLALSKSGLTKIFFPVKVKLYKAGFLK